MFLRLFLSGCNDTQHATLSAPLGHWCIRAQGRYDSRGSWLHLLLPEGHCKCVFFIAKLCFFKIRAFWHFKPQREKKIYQEHFEAELNLIKYLLGTNIIGHSQA